MSVRIVPAWSMLAVAAAMLLALLPPPAAALLAYDTPPASYGVIDSTDPDFPYAPYTDLDPADPEVRVHAPEHCPTQPTPIGFGFSFYGRQVPQMFVFPQGFVTFDTTSPCIEGTQIVSASPAGCASDLATCTSYTERRLYCLPTAASCTSTFSSIGYVTRNHSGGAVTSSFCTSGSGMPTTMLNAAAFNQVVAAAWSSRLTPTAPACSQGGLILSKVEGPPGERVLRIQWQSIRLDVCCSYPRQSFQVSLHEADSHIEVNYRTLNISCCLQVGGGIENKDGTRGYDHLAGTRVLTARAVAYFPKPLVEVTKDPAKPCVARPTALHATVPAAPAMGGLQAMAWNWGDGSGSSGTDPSKTYLKRDNFTAVVRATFGNGLAFDTDVRIRTYNCIPPVARFDAATGDQSDATPRDLSEDPDGAIVDWLWDFGDGTTVRGRDPGPHFYAFADVYTIRLTVTDTEGFNDTAALRVPVHGPPHYIGPMPVADAGEDLRVAPGATVALDGSGGDAHRSVRATWTQVGGPTVALVNPDSPRPSFTAPELRDGMPAELAFSLTLYDGHYTSEPDLVRVTVALPGGRPTAEAGPDQVVLPGAMVRLDGRASSDPDLDPLAYRWSQVGGPRVDLREPETATPSFVAPAEPAELRFRLLADDGRGEPAADTLTVAVVAGEAGLEMPGFTQARVSGRPGALTFTAPAPLLTSVARHAWDFGDGTAMQEGRQVTHTYVATGTYEVIVTALDAEGTPLYAIPGEAEVYLPAGSPPSPEPSAKAPGAGAMLVLALAGAGLVARRRR